MRNNHTSLKHENSNHSQELSTDKPILTISYLAGHITSTILIIQCTAH